MKIFHKDIKEFDKMPEIKEAEDSDEIKKYPLYLDEYTYSYFEDMQEHRKYDNYNDGQKILITIELHHGLTGVWASAPDAFKLAGLEWESGKDIISSELFRDYIHGIENYYHEDAGCEYTGVVLSTLGRRLAKKALEDIFGTSSFKFSLKP